MNLLKILSLILIACGFWQSTLARASLVNFDFSITSDPVRSNVNGTVTGEIIGLEDNGTSTPSNIIITSIPAGFGFSAPPEYSLADNGWTLTGDGSFTVSNDQITQSNYIAQTDSSDFSNFLEFSEDNGVSYTTNGIQDNLFNFNGSAGVTFTPEEVPEPSSRFLLFVSLVVFIASISVNRYRQHA